MELTLGSTPVALSVILSPGFSFAASFRRRDGQAWDATPIVLDFGGVTWTAATFGTVASFHESASAVDAVVATKPERVRLHYGDVLWAAGHVSVQS